MTEPLKLGTQQRYGETTCGYGVDSPMCDKPAVWHLLWLPANDDASAMEVAELSVDA